MSNTRRHRHPAIGTHQEISRSITRPSSSAAMTFLGSSVSWLASVVFIASTAWLTPITFLALMVTVTAPCLVSRADEPNSRPQATSLSNEAAAEASRILDESQIAGGLVVHIGCGVGELTAALQSRPAFQVHGLDKDAANVAAARQRIAELGKYGPVSVEHWRGGELPYIENLINLIVVEQAEDVPRDELLRVLVPNGVAMTRAGAGGWSKLVKPPSDEIDEWTHYLYDSTGNAVARDKQVGPPRRLQWLGSPRWSRHHDRMASMSALVSAGGRMFYIMDEGSRLSIQLPPKWTLVARDAFNGTVLWKQPIATWQNHLWPLKSGPTQLARRLVAVDDRVYVTLGFHAPLVALDARTGEIVRQYQESGGTEEVVFVDGTLIAQVNRGAMETDDFAPALNVGDQGRVAREYRWNEQPRELIAYDAESGEQLWTRETVVSPLTVAATTDNVFYHDGLKVVCVDRLTGEESWTTEPAARRQTITLNFGPKLVAYQGIVLFAGGDRTMKAFDGKSGKLLWTAPHAQSGYQSPEDLLVVNGLVWSAPTTRTQDTGIYSGLDPLTGEVKKEFPPRVDTYWFHHRCYIAKGTDKFILPSRTGVEFVNTDSQQWDIHHWVRGGCLYGVMPCNGLVCAPPHNCACYPEAKLYGFNALAPESTSFTVPSPDEIDDEARLESGPAFGDELTPLDEDGLAADWPTYRHDASRSGSTPLEISTELTSAWQTELGGKLSAVTVADGRLYVAQVDAHTLHSLDASTGARLWQFTAGGRIDSPPTIHQGRVLFGSADGYVYSLRATDGQLVWRFRGAPVDRRMTAFEQLESVWPVHGSVMVQDGVATFCAGRSSFLDSGMRLVRIDAASGRKLSETVLDDRDPASGENLQTRLQVLQMPVGLADIVSSDGQYTYMRSQLFDRDGQRLNLGPHSGLAPEHGATQKGEGRHLFAPTGFLDDTWFHRSYWVFGRSFAGGHSGYFQAGKYTPSGRMLVFNDDKVFGFARKPQYYRWTTIIEHELFSSSKEAAKEALGDSENMPTPTTPSGQPLVVTTPRAGGGGNANANNRNRNPNNAANNNAATGSGIRFGTPDSLDPTGRAITVEAWVNAERREGVVLAHGGPAEGYALAIRGGKPVWYVRADSELATVTADVDVHRRWVHLMGVVGDDKKMHLYVDGKLAASGATGNLVTKMPVQGLEIGCDDGGAVGEYTSPLAFAGLIDEVIVYHGAATAEEVAARARDPQASLANAKPALRVSFDKADARDESPNKLAGQLTAVVSKPAKVGRGMEFKGSGNRGGGNAANAVGSFVEHHWNQDLPLFVTSLALAGDTLLAAGPPDMIDEEETFQKLTERDPRVQELLNDQNAALEGQHGALLHVVDTEGGEPRVQIKIDSLPVWDGLAVARGRVYLATQDGKITCWQAAVKQDE